jgi:hypothetical protein
MKLTLPLLSLQYIDIESSKTQKIAMRKYRENMYENPAYRNLSEKDLTSAVLGTISAMK